MLTPFRTFMIATEAQADAPAPTGEEDDDGDKVWVVRKAADEYAPA